MKSSALMCLAQAITGGAHRRELSMLLELHLRDPSRFAASNRRRGHVAEAGRAGCRLHGASVIPCHRQPGVCEGPRWAVPLKCQPDYRGGGKHLCRAKYYHQHLCLDPWQIAVCLGLMSAIRRPGRRPAIRKFLHVPGAAGARGRSAPPSPAKSRPCWHSHRRWLFCHHGTGPCRWT